MIPFQPRHRYATNLIFSPFVGIQDKPWQTPSFIIRLPLNSPMVNKVYCDNNSDAFWFISQYNQQHVVDRGCTHHRVQSCQLIVGFLTYMKCWYQTSMLNDLIYVCLNAFKWYQVLYLWYNIPFSYVRVWRQNPYFNLRYILAGHSTAFTR